MGGVLNINYDHLLDCLSLIRNSKEKDNRKEEYGFQLFTTNNKESIS